MWKERNLFTTKVVTHPLPELTGGQQSSRLDNGALAMDPFWLYSVEPGTPGGQPAGNDAYAGIVDSSFLQHSLVVLAQPGFDLLAHVSGGIIPNEHQHVLES